MRYVAKACLVALVSLSNACNTSPEPAEEILANSPDATSDLQSFRITGNIVVESEEGVQEARIWQEWSSPDRWHMKLESLDQAVGQFSEVIIAERPVFARESDSSESNKGGWREQTVSFDSRGLYRNRGSVIPSDLENLKLLEDDKVNGVPVFQLTGEQLSAARSGAGHPGI